MIDQLFGSKTRVKLLQLFYANPNRSFYVREITRRVDEQINSVRRELSNLLSIGIISSETTNNKLYYEVNQSYDHYGPLLEIFGGSTDKSQDDEEDEKTDKKLPPELRPLGHIKLVLFTGKFTRDEKSGVDLLLVGDINQAQLSKYITDLEKKEKKEVRYVVMKPDEFVYRKKINDRFLITILESKKHVAYDKTGETT